MLNTLACSLHQYKYTFILVLGTILGALLRWQITSDFYSNLFGAAFIGLIFGLKLNSRLQMALSIGFCASLTSFSGWMWDAFQFFNSGYLLKAFIEIALTLFGGFVTLFLGFFIGKKISCSFLP